MDEAARPRALSQSLLSTASETLSHGPVSPRRVDNWDSGDVDYIEHEAAVRAQIDVPYHPGGFSLRILAKYMGPGWLMSLAYLDPGNIEADLQSGAYAGYSLLWLLLLCHAIGLLVQVLAARLGVVTGLNLAEMARLEYAGSRRWALWVMTELAIIGSDIQEVVGSAIAFQLLFGWPLWVGCVVTACDSFTFLALHFLGVRTFETFVAGLIGTMAICFFADAFLAAPPATSIVSGLVPEVRSYAVLQAVGTLGAVIMPHNIFLHSALVQSRRVDRTNELHLAQANMYNAVESAVALLVSFLINAAVICCFARGFFAPECAPHGLACVPTSPGDSDGDGDGDTPGAADIACESGVGPGFCDQVGLSVAGTALHKLLPGSSARMVWALGLLAAGQSSTMTGTLAGQFVMEGFLSLRIERWKRVLLTRSIALGPAVVVALLCQANPSAGDTADEWLNVLQSVQLPFAVLPLVVFTNDREIMGPFANEGAMRIGLWLLVLAIVVVNVYLVATFAFSAPRPWWAYSVGAVLFLLYFGFIARLLSLPCADMANTVGRALGLRCGKGLADDREAEVLNGTLDAGDGATVIVGDNPSRQPSHGRGIHGDG